MNTAELKKFAQTARRELREQVTSRLEQVLRTDSAALREKSAAVRELQEQIACTSKKAVIDRVAYTWFNRFCALRFMDVNHYTRMGVISPTEGFTQPEILQEAKQGYIAEELQRLVDSRTVLELLNGQRPSADPQGEAYRLLLVGICNFYNTAMPFLFEKIADYTELLMPQDLLSEHSILHDLRTALTLDTCQDVEAIGWLYQFYISERKDEVFEALKNNQKIEAEDIPAATQLFTPHWIVRYLIENSLGRLWMLNRPNSCLGDRMDYYIRHEEPESDFLRMASPEEIKVCDPACGSGHMLTYAFDLLYAIYEEAGYPTSDIPRLILERNLYGIEIDERAGALAAFALAMKARRRDRRFFNRGVQPNICVLENISFTDQELKEYAVAMGQDLFTEPLLQTLRQFEDAKNFGSLITPTLKNITYVSQEMERKGLSNSILLYGVHKRVLQALNQVKYLSTGYHIVVANPPYMGGNGYNDEIKDFAKDHYPDSKPDLFAMFIERNVSLAIQNGLVGMITMQSWMFLSSFEELRKRILREDTILSMAHFGPRAFDSIGGEVVSTTAFIIEKKIEPDYKGTYIRLLNGNNEEEKQQLFLECLNSNISTGKKYLKLVSINDLKRIPGSPIVYWVSDKVRKSFEVGLPLEKISEPKQGATTSDNNRFLRFWFEVARRKTGFHSTNINDAKGSGSKWFAYNKGGSFRRWYGNQEYVINYYNDGEEIKAFHEELNKLRPGGRLKNQKYYFLPELSWSKVSSDSFSVRFFPAGFIFDVAGSSMFFEKETEYIFYSALLNSSIVKYFMSVLSPTLNYEAEHLSKIPVVQLPEDSNRIVRMNAEALISLSMRDWNSYETSWNFISLAFLEDIASSALTKQKYQNMRENWHNHITAMQQLEEENNRIFIETYGLQGEIVPEVSLDEISLTCNPHYRYSGNRSEAELEALLLADTIREFISYTVGCMFGRYSLDKPGLILANQGETQADYLRQIPDPTFLPDEDNVIPVLEGEWFSDDITERFKKFLRITFGAEHYEENLAFIEQAIGRDIRSYFLKEFYAQHVKMYQKRPIYWMFSSPKGSFNVLVYMHRYKPDTISVILNKYLREFRGKLEARKAYLEGISISASAPAREKTAALKELEKLNKIMAELLDYERETLYPLAIQKIAIDLDDGVKVNYNKFGKALAKITGLSE